MIVLNLLLVALVLPAFVLMGGECCRALLRRHEAPLPLPLRLVENWIFGTALIAAVQALSFLFPVYAMRGIAWCYAALVVAMLIRRRKFLSELSLKTIPLSCFLPLLFLMALGAISIGLLIVSPYPGPVTAGYGDLPSYYRIAQNLSEGRFPLIDFRVGDYAGEMYTPPLKFPLLLLVSSFFHYFFPSRYVLEVYSMCSGFLLFGLFLLRPAKTHPFKHRLVRVFLFVGITTGFSLLLQIVLGALILPATLFLGYFIFAKRFYPDAGNIAFWQRLLVLVLLFIARPEGALLAMLFASFAGLEWLWGRHVAVKIACAIGLLGGLTALVVNAAHIRLGSELPENFLAYDTRCGEFHLKPRYWWMVNWEQSRQSLGEKGEDLSNPAIVVEITQHPAAFAAWLTEGAMDNVGKWPFIALLFFAALGYVLARRDPETRIAMGLLILFLPILYGVNMGFSHRHSLPVILLILLNAADRLEPLLVAFLTRLKWLGTAGLVVGILWTGQVLQHHFALAYGHRHADRSIGFAHIFKHLAPVISPDALIASSYPQLVSYALDRPSVGNSVLATTLPGLLRTYHPDIIILDEARDGFPNYQAFKEHYLDKGIMVPGYRVLMHHTGAPLWIALQREH